ncbi:MAG: SIS domain-containing protein [Anaerolineaceae bacterium]|nr:SIS domain-containing protein [Anaerolineaceae bacterium]
MQTQHANAITGFYQAIQAIQEQILSSQMELLETVAGHMADAIRQKKRIFIFGTGHSHMLMEEAYYRAGGIPGAVPVFVSSLMLHGSAGLSSRMERVAGLAAPILDQYTPAAGELIFIYSNSGVNQLPVELALDAKSRGMIVVAVCSKEYAQVAPLSALKQRLCDVADYAIDNYGIPGDAVLAIEGCPWRVGSSSTISGALIWNCLLAEAITRLSRETADLPVFASFNMAGAKEQNEKLIQQWASINPHLPSPPPAASQK